MLVVHALYLLLAVASAEVSISDNGYSGVLVGISQDTDQAEGEALIAAIKVSWYSSQSSETSADTQLFKQLLLNPLPWLNEAATAASANQNTKVKPAAPATHRAQNDFKIIWSRNC